jgi:hypothetical protein
VIIGHASRQSGRLATPNTGGATRPADSCETGGNRSQDLTAKEGHVMHRHWNHAMQSLVLIRIGQELGTDSPAARALHDLLELLASVTGMLAR